MKVIAGKYGGRRLSFPKTAQTRPLSDKVREALFNILGDVSGLSILDAYAGSGAVSFEALSRGAGSAVAVEKAKEAWRAIQESQKSLNLEAKLKVVPLTIAKSLPALAGSSFDLIVADPPYGQLDAVELEQLGRLLAPQGIMVVSHSSRIDPPQLESMQRIDNRKYGDSSLSFYRK